MNNDKNNEEVPMIPKHQHQAEMMHMSRANRNILIVSICAFVCMIIMAYIFVTGYTSRTKDWLTTYNNLQQQCVEVKHGQKESTVQ